MHAGHTAQWEHTRQLHFTAESSGSNILAEWTSNLPNDLWAVKDIAANSNCKNYIGFRRGMAFGRLCFKRTVGERKRAGCSSQSEKGPGAGLGVRRSPYFPLLFIRFTAHPVGMCGHKGISAICSDKVSTTGFSLPSPFGGLSSSTVQVEENGFAPTQHVFSNTPG